MDDQAMPADANEQVGRRTVPIADPAWTPRPQDFAESTVTRRFEEVVARTPDAPAVTSPSVTWSYAELDARANQLANHLREEPGVLGRPVGLLMAHDAPLVAAIFGVMKAGGIVVVLDPVAPPAVTAAVVADATPALIVVDEASSALAREIAGDVATTSFDQSEHASTDRPPLGSGPASPAMLAYSSGTTADAKAAVIPHRALLHLARGASDELRLTARDHMPMLFPVSMAVAAYPMLLPLLAGGSLHIRDVRSVGLAGFHQWLADEAISVLYLSPTVARFLGDAPADVRLDDLRLLVLGGERVDGDAVAVVRSAIGGSPVIANGYGTAETGVLTFYIVGDHEVFADTGVPVGRPIPDTELTLVGDDGNPVAPGEMGELVVRSRFLASGYWRRPDLDAVAFSAVPEQDAMDYRTGDLAFVDPQGDLVLVGRSDTEVKVRGHRVIPGKVEQAMLALPEVADAVVDARPDAMGTNELIAWVVPAPDADGTSIRRAAEAAMRAPWVPARIVLLDELPLLPNGKLDRRALPAPPEPSPEPARQEEIRQERTETEAAVAHIWQRILDVEHVATDADLADLGAQSLDMAWALVRIEEDLGVRVAMGEVIGLRSVAELAAVVDRLRRGTSASRALIEVQRGSADRPRLFMVHDLHGSAYGLRHLAPHLGEDQPLWGFESPYLEGPEPPFRTLDTLALRYVTELRRVQPEGPYHLAGYSFGGVLAFEIARQLVESGQEVASLVVVDVGPGYRGRHYDPKQVLDKPWLRVPMPEPDTGLVEQVRWYVQKARRSPSSAALSLSIRTGADRWTDPVLFRRDLRRNGEISAGNRLWYSWRRHWELARHYSWEGREYPGPLTLVWADESASTDGSMGWGDIVGDRLHIVHVPVAHERFLQPDGAEVLGPILRAAIDRAEHAP